MNVPLSKPVCCKDPTEMIQVGPFRDLHAYSYYYLRKSSYYNEARRPKTIYEKRRICAGPEQGFSN